MAEMKNKRSDWFIVGRADVLENPDLKPAEKLVYMRIAGFELFFESREETARKLGLKASRVRDAVQTLERLGYIECVKDTGHGKVYRPVFGDTTQRKQAIEDCKQITEIRQSELTDYRNSVSRLPKFGNIEEKENKYLSTYVDKGASAASEAVSKSNSPKVAKKAESDSKPSYGNSAINAMFDYWQTQVGTPIISREKSNRRACYNLLRNKHIGEEKLRHAVEFVGKIKEDRFAPRISDFVDLQSKFNALCDYKNRRDEQTPTFGTNDAYKRNGELTRASNKAGGYVPFVPSQHDARQDDYEAEQARWAEAERNRADDEFVQKMYDETMSKLKGSRR